MKVIHFVPFHASELNGITDYACKLADKLDRDHGTESAFIVPARNRDCSGSDQVEDDEFGKSFLYVRPTNLEQWKSLFRDIQVLIIHYGFYVSPFTEIITSLVKERKFKLIVMFHELIPSSSSLARKIPNRVKQVLPIFPAKDPGPFRSRLKLAKSADFIFTNTLKFKTMLSSWQGKPVTYMPCFSNIGEPSDVPLIRERDRRMIVFGSEATRRRIYMYHMQSLINSCQDLGINEVCDIGQTNNLKFPDMPTDKIKFVSLGSQKTENVSELLLRSRAGFFDYSHNPGTLGKSGVFAAYCAHGMVPISSTHHPVEVDLEADQHYFVPRHKRTKLSEDQMQSIASSAHGWYSAHSIGKCSTIYAKHIFS